MFARPMVRNYQVNAKLNIYAINIISGQSCWLSSNETNEIIILMLKLLTLNRIYSKVPLREVPRGVAQARNPSIQHLTGWANKICMVVVKTKFLSAALEAGGGEAPFRRRFALSPSSWRNEKK